jgi:hypothetical protein
MIFVVFRAIRVKLIFSNKVFLTIFLFVSFPKCQHPNLVDQLHESTNTLIVLYFQLGPVMIIQIMVYKLFLQLFNSLGVPIGLSLYTKQLRLQLLILPLFIFDLLVFVVYCGL